MSELMTGTDPYREGEWTEQEPSRKASARDVMEAAFPAMRKAREEAERAAELAASLPQPKWTVHVAFVDAQGNAEEDRIGDGRPRIEGGALIVEVFGDPDDDQRVTFHAGWSLRHVHTWFVDYAENDES